jgi:hypothetical protein
MHRMNRDLRRKGAILAAALGVVLVCAWAAAGFDGGMLFPIAIGAATAVAIFGDTRSTCAPRFLRRRG